jgi:predicted PurR-regulated permease PerM
MEPERPPWRDLHLWQIQPIRDLLVVAGVVGILYLGYMLSVVTVPILLALLLAYLFEPVISRLVRVRWFSRQGAAVLVIASAALVIVVPVTLGIGFAAAQGVAVARSIAQNSDRFLAVTRYVSHTIENDPDAVIGVLDAEEIGGVPTVLRLSDAPLTDYRQLPSYWQKLCDAAVHEQVKSLRRPARDEADDDAAGGEEDAEGGEDGGGVEGTGDVVLDEQVAPTLVERPSTLNALLEMSATWVQGNAQVIARRALGTGVDAVGALVRTVTSVGLLLFEGFLTAFFFFFFSTGYERVVEFARKLIPEKKQPMVLDLLGKMDRVIAGFVRGRLTIAFLQSVFFALAYWIVGVPMPLVVGPIVGILSIVPYVALIGIPLSIVLMLIEPSGEGFRAVWWWIVIAPTVVYFLGQALDDYVLSPIIQGKSTDMDTPSILFASIAGGALAGIYGLLLAIPVAACAKILLREVFWPRFKAWAEGREQDFLPIDRD